MFAAADSGTDAIKPFDFVDTVHKLAQQKGKSQHK
jgi:hypothetical protein